MGPIVHVPLDEHGLPGQWADVRDPKFLTRRTIERWQKSDDGVAALRELVAAWHLIDGDTGEELNNPASDSIDGIPMMVFRVINERIGQLFRGTVAEDRNGQST